MNHLNKVDDVMCTVDEKTRDNNLSRNNQSTRYKSILGADAGFFFVRNPSKSLQIKCGTNEFRHSENEFRHFENEFHHFESKEISNYPKKCHVLFPFSMIIFS